MAGTPIRPPEEGGGMRIALVDMLKRAMETDQTCSAPYAIQAYETFLERYVTATETLPQAAIDRATRGVEMIRTRVRVLRIGASKEAAAPTQRLAAAGGGGGGGGATSSTSLTSLIPTPPPPLPRGGTPPDMAAFDKIAGLDHVKRAFTVSAIMPLSQGQIFGQGVIPFSGILLYGPPGTGKTLITQALTKATGSHFVSISCADILGKYMGESEKRLKAVFAEAVTNAPSILFVDEIDSIGRARGEESEAANRIKTQLLIELSDLKSSGARVVFVGATNLPWALDSALNRRFQQHLYVPLPNPTARRQFILQKLEEIGIKDDSLVAGAVTATEGYSGSDLDVLLMQLSRAPLDKCFDVTHFEVDGEGFYTPSHLRLGKGIVEVGLRDIPPGKLRLPPITTADFEAAIGRTRPSVPREEVLRYEEWAAR